MNYLVVCRTDGKLFLLMVPNGEGIQAYSSEEEVMKAFSGYTQAWTRHHTDSASACLGMMQMQPVAIEAPNQEEIEKYVTEMKLYRMSGGAIGRGYYGIPVSEDILSLKQFDIWEKSMELAGIKSKSL